MSATIIGLDYVLPTIVGTLARQRPANGTALTRFSTIAMGDPNGGPDTLTIALTGLTANPNGTYTLTGTAIAEWLHSSDFARGEAIALTCEPADMLVF